MHFNDEISIFAKFPTEVGNVFSFWELGRRAQNFLQKIANNCLVVM